MQTLGDAVVILEGSRRLRWDGSGATWRLAGLWPSEADIELLDRHLEDGRPLLVVLDREPAVVSALVDEVPRVPDGLIVRSEDAGVLELQVTALDWLPEPLRDRGRKFAGRAAAEEQSMPRYSVPPLLVDPGPLRSPIRFARRTATCGAITKPLLESVLTELFSLVPARLA